MNVVVAVGIAVAASAHTNLGNVFSSAQTQQALFKVGVARAPIIVRVATDSDQEVQWRARRDYETGSEENPAVRTLSPKDPKSFALVRCVSLVHSARRAKWPSE